MRLKSLIATAVLIAAIPALAACSGGGGGGGSSTPIPSPTPIPTPTPTPTPTPSSSWTQGVYQPASNFEAMCAVPRTGFDIEGNPYTDVQGTLLDELNWLRSWTHETYLWNDEVTDQDPSGFATTDAYFDVLKTFAVTPSGEDKDDFHFHQPTEDYLAARNSAGSAGYGASFVILSATPPRDVRVRYTDPDTPASTLVGGEPPFQRGAKILEIDGVDVINANSSDAVDTLNAGLYPSTTGETHTFLVQDVGQTSRTVSVTSADVASVPVNRTAVIDQNGSRVGYILFNTFSPYSSEKAIADAMEEMRTQGVSDLIIDLRYNGGGLLAVAAQLGYMVAGDTASSGKTFELLQFNDDAGLFNPVTGEFNDPFPFVSTGLGFSLASGTPLPALNLQRVFILSTGSTCSASEAVINGLRGIDIEIVLIGDITCGKPYGFYPTDNCGETWYSIQFQGVNDKGFGDYADGFVPADNSFLFGEKLPGCTVDDDLDHELGDTSEALLSAALTYRETGACPAAAPKVLTSSSESAKKTDVLSDDGLAIDTDKHEDDTIYLGRDVRMPY